MSIIIKGLSLPERGCVNVQIWPDGRVVELKGGEIGTAMELPDHGDLIDRDDAENAALLIWCHSSNGDDAMEQTIAHIRHNIVAVIPAERSEDADY